MLRPHTPQKLRIFQSIQKALSYSSTLIYYTLDKILWIDLDASKKFRFRVVIFHTTTNEKLS